MDKMMHLAAQYLAAAGKSFLERKEDDSHTNLDYDPEYGTLRTHLLSELSDSLSLNYCNFTLNWNSFDGITSLGLDGTSHEEILEWLEEVSQTFIGKSYTFDLHYELPYTIDADFIYKLLDANRMEYLNELRRFSQLVLNRFLKENSMESDIRIWPHHFDTGAFVPNVGERNLSIGLGMAIPDSMTDHYYFYLGGYDEYSGIDTAGFVKLSTGVWKNEGFKGAILPISEINEREAVQFLNEALKAYVK